VKIGQVDPEIIWLKLKKSLPSGLYVWQSLAYNLLGVVVSPPSEHL